MIVTVVVERKRRLSGSAGKIGLLFCVLVVFGFIQNARGDHDDVRESSRDCCA